MLNDMEAYARCYITIKDYRGEPADSGETAGFFLFHHKNNVMTNTLEMNRNLMGDCNLVRRY